MDENFKLGVANGFVDGRYLFSRQLTCQHYAVEAFGAQPLNFLCCP